jgi:hypothetical protein
VFLAILVLTAAAGADEVKWYDHVSVFGLIDTRAEFSQLAPNVKGVQDVSVSDVYVYWAQLGANVVVNPYVSGVFSVIFEEAKFNDAANPFGPDKGEAYVTFQYPLTVTPYVSIGRLFPPVGRSLTFGTTDSLPYLMTYTWQTAMGVGAKMKWFDVSGWFFNGAIDTTGKDGKPRDNLVDEFAVRGTVFPLAFQDTHALEVGGYYLSDALETTFALRDRIAFVGNYEDAVPLWGVFANAVLPFSDLVALGLNGEFVSTRAFDRKNYADNAGDATAVSAWLAEAAVKLFRQRLTIGVRIEGIRGLDWLGTQAIADQAGVDFAVTDYLAYGGFLGADPWTGILVGLQSAHGADNEGNQDDTVAFQAALKF